MKIAATIARYLLGLIFAFFGANLLHPFLPNPPIPPGPMKDFTTVMGVTRYFAVVGFFQFVPGVLLLINRFVPLALTVLAAELVNILTTHALVIRGGFFPVPILAVLCWILVFWRVRSAFTGILQAKVHD